MVRNSIRLLALLLAATFTMPGTSHADFRRICRGGNLPKYLHEIKTDVKEKLTAAAIPFNSVQVRINNVKRATDISSPDFSSNLTVSAGPVSSVSFTGAFPTLTTCDITGKLKITVRYPNGSATTTSNVTIPGTMLFRANIGNDAD